MTMLEHDVFISVPEVARTLSVHTALVYREIKAGRLKAVRIGTKKLRVSRVDLAGYIETQHTAGQK